MDLLDEAGVDGEALFEVEVEILFDTPAVRPMLASWLTTILSSWVR